MSNTAAAGESAVGGMVVDTDAGNDRGHGVVARAETDAAAEQETAAREVAGHEVAGHEHTPEDEDRPEDWGWHAEGGKMARGAGWVSAAVLLVINLGNHTRHIADIWLTAIAAFIVALLLIDRHRRKNSWRD